MEEINRFYNILADSADKFLNINDFNEELCPDSYELKNGYFATIDIKGDYNGNLLLITDRSSLKEIFEKVFFYEWDENENEDLITNGVCELLNIIASTSVEMFNRFNLNIRIGTPLPLLLEEINYITEAKHSCLRVFLPDASVLFCFIPFNRAQQH